MHVIRISEVVDAHKTRPNVLHRILKQAHGKSIQGALHKCQTSPKVCKRESKFWSKKGRELSVVGYCDSDYGGDSVHKKSTSGAFFFLGHNIVTWMSQNQRIVALSSCEAEYISLTLAACQGVWLADLITEVTRESVKLVKIFVDNKSVIDLAKSPIFHSRSKHIKIRYHYVRACVQSGEVDATQIQSNEQRADILTKSLRKEKFSFFRNFIGISDARIFKEIKGENVGN